VSDETMSPEEVAELLAFKGKNPRRFVKRLPIPQVRLSKYHILYMREDVMDYLRKHRHAAA
jgi:hypothetical protein